MTIKNAVDRLINYALQQNLIELCDVIYIRNQYYFLLNLPYAKLAKQPNKILSNQVLNYPDDILHNIYNYVKSKPELRLGLNKDMVISNLMNVVMPMPRIVRSTFKHIHLTHGITKALEYFYQLSIAGNYVKMADIAKNHHWLTNTPYGKLEITINLSKPEKDPKEIALNKLNTVTNYPKCLLCAENEGFAGDYAKPSRFTHRIIPLRLNKETWYFQFSPYLYYKEHSIIFSSEHRDMQINPDTFKALFDFVDLVPHYLIGANADIPIVGGSILNHDHFQAGNHIFPLEHAKTRANIAWKAFPKVSAKILDWPLSVIKLNGNRQDLLHLSKRILSAWIDYSDETVGIQSHSIGKDGSSIRHNTLNPIVRKLAKNQYQIFLILRNNRVNNQYPDGIFHPHQHLHHIKKENIGLIEAMGLAILPGRLHKELNQIEEILLANDPKMVAAINAKHSLWQHKNWLIDLIKSNPKFSKRTVKSYLQYAIGEKFMQVLECCGVFKNTSGGNAAFMRFIKSVGGNYSQP